MLLTVHPLLQTKLLDILTLLLLYEKYIYYYQVSGLGIICTITLYSIVLYKYVYNLFLCRLLLEKITKCSWKLGGHHAKKMKPVAMIWLSLVMWLIQKSHRYNLYL